MDQAKLKILICGDVEGKFKDFFKKIESINNKTGPFDLLLCAGNFFGDNIDAKSWNIYNEYKDNKKTIPIPIYILGPNQENHNKYYKDLVDGEICSNLTYLGNRGVYTFSNGLKVAYLSGIENSGKSNNANHFNKNDVITVRNSCLNSKYDYKGVDILLTSQWPATGDEEKPTSKSSKLISWLAKEIKPRYIFCGLNGTYHEPPVYRAASDKSSQYELSIRVLGLAKVANDLKAKYLYALSIVPIDKMRIMDLIQKTTDEIPSPFEAIHSEISSFMGEKVDQTNQYFYDQSDNRGKRKSSDNAGHKKKRMTVDQDKCWFCLSSDVLEKDLILTIGEHFYIALAKGPINDTHILILPITHIQSSSYLSDDQWEELQNFKKALKSFFNESDKSTIFFERNYKTAHMQINAVGIGKNIEWKAKHVCEDKSEEHNLEFEILPQLKSPADYPRGPFFVADLPDDTNFIIKQMRHFPINFGREILCDDNLLNCSDNIDWRSCDLSKEKELEMVQNFKTSFKKYDFTN